MEQVPTNRDCLDLPTSSMHYHRFHLFATVDAALLLLSKLNLGGGQVAPDVEVQPKGGDGMLQDVGEATRHGVIILPDTCHGWGPLYVHSSDGIHFHFLFITPLDLCSYICCLLVKRAGYMGGVGDSDEDSESEGGDCEAGRGEA